jgi:hypothetical protein
LNVLKHKRVRGKKRANTKAASNADQSEGRAAATALTSDVSDGIDEGEVAAAHQGGFAETVGEASIATA